MHKSISHDSIFQQIGAEEAEKNLMYHKGYLVACLGGPLSLQTTKLYKCFLHEPSDLLDTIFIFAHLLLSLPS